MSNSKTSTPEVASGDQMEVVAWRVSDGGRLWVLFHDKPNWSDDKSVIYQPLVTLDAAHKALAERDGAVDRAEQLLTMVEERFPDWKSYRDLIDCIDATLADRGSAR